jgi:hypothetical protein
MLKINLNWTQLLSGLSTPRIKSTDDLSYISNNWFKELREFLVFIDSMIVVKDCWVPIKKQANNVCIMDQVNQMQIPNHKKQLFNNWRLFFQVDTISNLINCSGEKIIKHFICRKYYCIK